MDFVFYAYQLLKKKVQLLEIFCERSKRELKKYEKRKKKSSSEKPFLDDMWYQDLKDFYDFREKIVLSLFKINERLMQKEAKEKKSFSPERSKEKKGEKNAFHTKDNVFLKEIDKLLNSEKDLLDSILFYDHQVLSFVEEGKNQLLRDLHNLVSDRRRMKSYKSLFDPKKQRGLMK